MATGLVATLANSYLNYFRGVSLTGISAFMKLHTGDPGPAGTANSSTVTTRNAVTWNAASGGAMTLSSIGTYAMTATEIITHVSFWDAATAGNFVRSDALSSGVSVVNGSVLTFTTVTLSAVPIAA